MKKKRKREGGMETPSEVDYEMNVNLFQTIENLDYE